MQVSKYLVGTLYLHFYGTKMNVSDIKYSRTINKDTGYAEVEYDEGSLESVIKKLFYEPVEEWPDDSDEE